MPEEFKAKAVIALLAYNWLEGLLAHTRQSLEITISINNGSHNSVKKSHVVVRPWPSKGGVLDRWASTKVAVLVACRQRCET